MGSWSGDYYVADWETLRANPEGGLRQVRAHRVREVIPPVEPTYRPCILLADYGIRQRILDLNPDVEEMFNPDDDLPREEPSATLQA